MSMDIQQKVKATATPACARSTATMATVHPQLVTQPRTLVRHQRYQSSCHQRVSPEKAMETMPDCVRTRVTSASVPSQCVVAQAKEVSINLQLLTAQEVLRLTAVTTMGCATSLVPEGTVQMGRAGQSTIRRTRPMQTSTSTQASGHLRRQLCPAYRHATSFSQTRPSVRRQPFRSRQQQ